MKIYIYIYMCVCVCVCIMQLSASLFRHDVTVMVHWVLKPIYIYRERERERERYSESVGKKTCRLDTVWLFNPLFWHPREQKKRSFLKREERF